MTCFELGPIRPPSEAESILLRLTRNCHWNKCAFCPVYKGGQFSLRTEAEVRHDIDAIRRAAEIIYRGLNASFPDRADNTGVADIFEDLEFGDDITAGCARQVAFWVYHGMRSLFLQDADALVHRTGTLVGILNYAKDMFPTIGRVTSYSRAKTLSRKSPEELASIRAAGLDRIHIGMETGCETVLELMNKGVTREEQVRAGRNVMAAGFELSEYFMPGLGGRLNSREHALESARVLSEVNPTFIRLRSTVPVPGTPLFAMMREKAWDPLGEEEKVREIGLFIENLSGITSTVKSDHIMNLLEEVEGTLPEDRDAMLAVIRKFLAMDRDDRESFIVGRRIGRYRLLSDYEPVPEIETLKRRLKDRYMTLDEGILEILANYI